MSRTESALILCIIATVPWPAPGQPAPVNSAGDPLPRGAIARIGTNRYRLPNLSQVFFSPDRSILIGKGGDASLTFWEAETGKTVAEFRDPDLINFSVDQSPDRTQLILFGHDRRGKPAPDTTLRLYDTLTRRPIWTKVISDEYHAQHFVRFAPDGKHVITGSNDIRVWDAKTGEQLARQKLRVGYRGFVLSPDGKTVAMGDQQLWLWNWQDGGAPRRVDTGTRRYFDSFTFSANGASLYASDGLGGRGYEYDVATGRFAGKVSESAFRWRAVSPDGKMLAVADYDTAKREGSVILRDPTTNKEIGRLQSGKLQVRQGCWSKDGRRLACATPFRAWVWDVKTGKAFGPDVPGHENTVTSLTFTGDGRLITASEDRTIRTWDPKIGKELARIRMDGLPWALAVSPGGDLMAGSQGSGGIRVWQTKSGKEVFNLVWSASRTGAGLNKAQFTADEQTLVTFSYDFYMRAWDTLTGKLKAERRFRPEALGPLDEDQDESLQVAAFAMQGIGLGADGDTLVLAFRKNVTAYSLATGKEKFKVEADPKYVSSLVLSADGSRLATAGPWSALGPQVRIVGPMPDQQRTCQVTVWDMKQAKQIARFNVTGTNPYSTFLNITPDGKWVVTATVDNTVRFWDAATGKAVGMVQLPRRAMRIAFGGDRLLAVTSADATIIIYDLHAALKTAKKE